MAPFSYIKEESLLGLVGLIVLPFYIILITYIKSLNKEFSFRLSYILFFLHFLIVIFLVIEMKCTIQYSNEGWLIPFIISLIFDLFRYIKNSDKRKNQ